MAGGSRDYEYEVDESNERNAFPTASQPRQATTGLTRFVLGTSNVELYDREDGDDGDVEEKAEALHDNEGSPWNVEV